MPAYAVRIKGLDELRKQIKDYPKIAGKHYRKAMRKSVTTIEEKVKPLTPLFRGRLRQSIVSEVRGTGVELTGVVGSNLKKEAYPAVMEFGRKPGAKMPPPKALERWVWLVLKPPKKMVKGIAFVIARAIGKRGIKGKRFLQRGFERSKRQVYANFSKALADIVKELAQQ
jgi:hypothetical protein